MQDLDVNIGREGYGYPSATEAYNSGSVANFMAATGQAATSNAINEYAQAYGLQGQSEQQILDFAYNQYKQGGGPWGEYIKDQEGNYYGLTFGQKGIPDLTSQLYQITDQATINALNNNIFRAQDIYYTQGGAYGPEMQQYLQGLVAGLNPDTALPTETDVSGALGYRAAANEANAQGKEDFIFGGGGDSTPNTPNYYTGSSKSSGSTLASTSTKQASSGPTYTKIDTANGPVYMKNEGGGLSVVNDPEILKKLRSGEIQTGTNTVKDIQTGKVKTAGVSNPELVPEGSARTAVQQDLQSIQMKDPSIGEAVPADPYYSSIQSQPMDMKDLLSQYGIDIDPESFLTNPTQSFSDVYNKLYNDLGIGELKVERENLFGKLNDLDQELADKIADINEDPWLTEGVRVSKIRKLNERYDLKRAVLTNNMAIYDTSIQSMTDQARFLVTGTYNQYNADRNFQLSQLQMLFDRVDTANQYNLQLQQLALQKEESAFDKAYKQATLDLAISDSAFDKYLAESQLELQQRQFELDQYKAYHTPSLSSADQKLFVGAGLVPEEIKQLQSDIATYGVDTVIASQTDPKVIDAIEDVYGIAKDKQFITKDYFRSIMTKDQLRQAAGDAGFSYGRGLFGGKTGDEGISDYLDYLMGVVERYREAGYSDKEILKQMM